MYNRKNKALSTTLKKQLKKLRKLEKNENVLTNFPSNNFEK
jgi:hypothetical protein